MNLRDLATRAKELVDKRGGTGSLKEDAEELKNIAKGEGSVTDKAKAAAEALKDPGGGEATDASPETTPAGDASTAEAARAEEKTEGEARGKHGDTRRRGGGQGKRRGGGGRGGGRGRDRV